MAGPPSRSERLARRRRYQHALVQLEPQFLPLLASVLLPVILLPLTVLPVWGGRWLLPLLLSVLVVQSLRALPSHGPNRRSRWLARLHRGLGGSVVLLIWVLAIEPVQRGFPVLRFPVLWLSGLFSLLAALRLVGVLARVPRVNPQVMAGAAAGYVYLGLTGGLIASALQVMVPGTFQLGETATGEMLVDRLTYFSFVVLAGLGLGDVVPHNPLGERFVILLSLSGTLYLVLLMGLLIGRFIATQEAELEFEALADQQAEEGPPAERP
ncbi:MAG: potassium channel family protein [Cyanobacteriota bacterium]|nr:potassium channel family protein [Cyanobacteriota bacterium]